MTDVWNIAWLEFFLMCVIGGFTLRYMEAWWGDGEWKDYILWTLGM